MARAAVHDIHEVRSVDALVPVLHGVLELERAGLRLVPEGPRNTQRHRTYLSSPSTEGGNKNEGGGGKGEGGGVVAYLWAPQFQPSGPS